MSVFTLTEQHLDELSLQLPSSDQLEAYRTLKRILENNPDEVPLEYKQTFARLVLVDPSCIDMSEVRLVEQLCPDAWQRYCEYHWGRAEEQRDIEEARWF